GPDSTFHLPTILSLFPPQPVANRATPQKTRNASLRGARIMSLPVLGLAPGRPPKLGGLSNRGGTELYLPNRVNARTEGRSTVGVQPPRCFVFSSRATRGPVRGRRARTSAGRTRSGRSSPGRFRSPGTWC